VNNWTVRIWVQEDTTGITQKSSLIESVHRLAKQHADDREKFTLAVVALPDVNAVEVLNSNGCGELAYSSWP